MSYSDPKYGVRTRLLSPEASDIGVAGVKDHCKFSFARKTKIIKFGIIPTASDCICTSTTNFTLETDAGTDLGTFTPGSAVFGTGTATGNTITATTVAANAVIKGNITVIGDSGSAQFYVDVEEQFDQADSA